MAAGLFIFGWSIVMGLVIAAHRLWWLNHFIPCRLEYVRLKDGASPAYA